MKYDKRNKYRCRGRVPCEGADAVTLRQPRLLSSDGTERCRLSPIHLQLTMNLAPLSSAEMVLPADGPAVQVRDLIELFDENGSAGIFRVTEIAWQPGMTRTIRLEHALATLSDGVVPAMTFTGTARGALEALLSHQPEVRWTLGDVALPEDVTVLFSCGCQNLLSALMQLMSLLPDTLMLSFDFAGSPWTLHVRAMENADACEGWLLRNVSSVDVEEDGSELCTRVYP